MKLSSWCPRCGNLRRCRACSAQLGTIHLLTCFETFPRVKRRLSHLSWALRSGLIQHRAKNEILRRALSSWALDGVGDSAVLHAIVPQGSGVWSDSKRMAVEAYSRKWELSERWEWSTEARDELRCVSISVSEPRVVSAEAPPQPQPLIAPASPDGVLLDYSGASTTPAGALKRALFLK